ncbi:YjgN family protein [Leptospira sp. GIMC2001]|uniref:YjgN family protein n=1 Tax=Leptospira sp. GIMC2001 TaxID=1513297 RepID=UPI00234BA8F9|nr:DUF898 family protein [Leptospira sp. GIMC2001]WCL49909.1 DUF898 family protein [Leptospira sp. GIMC2001]
MDNNRVQFHATGGGLFVLYLKNMFFTVITLGIYRFWAITNIQKFMAENIEWAGERFSFNGTGKERFIGFLKAAAIIVVVFIANYILGWIFGLILGQYGSYLSMIILFALFIGIIPFIVVGNRRFMTSRTGYRNLRFGFDGKPLELAMIYIKGIPLTAITLGLYYPIFYIDLETYMKAKTRYGNTNFAFQADNKEFFILCIKGFFLTLITLGIYGSWFYADVQNFLWKHTSFQGKNFNNNLTGGAVFKNFLIAYVIVLFTLGIGFAWAIARVMKLHLEAISLESAVDWNSISAQPDTEASATAEGLEAIANSLEGFMNY